jgi:hypothetical protein
MKLKLSHFFVFLALCGFLGYGFITLTSQIDPNSEAAFTTEGAPVYTGEVDTNAPAGFPYATQWNFNYSTINGPNSGTVGAIKFGNHYILNKWNTPNMWYRYNADGPNGGPGTLADSTTYPGAIRDLTVAPDGSGTDFLWGSNASTSLRKMNATGQTIASYTLSGSGNIRAIAWDPNRKGFWFTDFSGNLVCKDTANNLKGTITSALTGKYGMAFDSLSTPDSAFVWVWNQNTDNLHSELVKYHAASGTLKATYSFNLTGLQVGIAGGAEIQVINGKVMLLLNYQNQAVVGYKMRDLTPAGNSTLVLYHDTLTGAADRKADRDTLNKYLPQLISNYDRYTYTLTDTLPNLSGYKTIIIQETNNDGIFLSTAARTKLINWLNSGTAGNKKALLCMGGDWGYNYSRAASTTRDTVFSQTYGGYVYRADRNTAALSLFGVSIDAGNQRLMSSTPPGGNWWPDLNSPRDAGVTVLYRHSTNSATDSVAGVSRNTTGYVMATLFADPRFFVNTGAAPSLGFKPVLSALIGHIVTSGGTVTSLGNEYTQTANDYRLSQNYPNPFNPSTKINFSIPKSGLVSLKVYDILGKEVATLVNTNFNAGTHTIEFNASNLSSGTYFYRIQAGNFTEVKKMLLLK